MPKRKNGSGLTANQELALIEGAMSGDLVMVITPETVTPVPTAAAWTRSVVVSIQNAAGEVQQWLNQTYATSATVSNDSTDGTATIESTTLSIVNGEATIVVSGDAEAWLTTETDTLTISSLSILGYTVAGGTSVETFTAV